MLDRPVWATLAIGEWGIGPAGPLLRLDRMGGLAVGPATAPVLVGWLQVIDRHWRIGLTDLEAAVGVR